MDRINKESVLLQSLVAIMGITLLIVGIVTVVSAWQGPAPQNQPVVNNVSTTQPPEQEPVATESPPATDSVALETDEAAESPISESRCPEEAEMPAAEPAESL